MSYPVEVVPGKQSNQPVRPIIHAEFYWVKFDLWCEDEWLEFRDKDYFYESDVLYSFLNFVRPGDVCIDAGANVGYHTLFLSRLVGDEGAVLAFEPDPTHFEKLQANIVLNCKNNIQAFPHILWNSDCLLDFWSIKGGGYSSLVNFINFNPTKIEAMPAVALDSVISSDANIRMMKLDCEGAEEQILHGAKETLKRTDCVVMEFNLGIMPIFGSTDRSIRDYMDLLGFDMFILRRDGTEPMPVDPKLKIEVKGRKPHTFNGLFLKRGSYEIPIKIDRN